MEAVKVKRDVVEVKPAAVEEVSGDAIKLKTEAE